MLEVGWLVAESVDRLKASSTDIISSIPIVSYLQKIRNILKPWYLIVNILFV